MDRVVAEEELVDRIVGQPNGIVAVGVAARPTHNEKYDVIPLDKDVPAARIPTD